MVGTESVVQLRLLQQDTSAFIIQFHDVLLTTPPASLEKVIQATVRLAFIFYGGQWKPLHRLRHHSFQRLALDVTRAAETFTIPSANLPWPEPNYIQTYIDDDFSSYADQTAMDSAGYNFFNTTFDAANDQVDFTATSSNLTFTDAASPSIPTGTLIEVDFSYKQQNGRFINFSKQLCECRNNQ